MDYLARLTAAHILIAEGDRPTMTRLTDILEEAGFNVQNSYYGGDALWALQHGQFDLVLVDTALLDENRRPLTDLMRHFAPLPWLAVVESAGPGAAQALRAGATGVIERNASPTALIEQVTAALNLRAKASDQRAGRVSDRITPIPEAYETAASSILQRRLIEQQTLSALARSLSSVLDVDTLLAQVVDAAVSLTNAEEGLLLLPDEDEKALYIRAVKGIDSETASNFRVKTHNTLAGQVFQTGKPVLVGDQGWQKIKTEYLVQSLLYVPLSSKGKTLGVLGVNNIKTNRTFTEHDRELLQDLAAHAAIAIENARLFEESIQRAAELQVLVQAGEAANSTLAIDRVLSVIANQLIGALGVSECYTLEQNPATGEFAFLAVSARATWRPDAGPAWSCQPVPAVDEAFRKKQIVAITPADLPQDETSSEWLPYRYGAESMVFLPLVAHNQRMGLITLYHINKPYYADAYPPGIMAQIQQLALDSVSQALTPGAAIPQKGLFRTAERIASLVAANWCEIALWDEARQCFQLLVSCGEGIWPEEPKPVIDLARFPKLMQVYTQRATITDAEACDLQPLVEARGAQSVLGVPLIIKERTAGFVLLVDTLHTRRFSGREVRLAQALVLQAANALENARLFRELERSLDELNRTQSKLVQAARLSAMGELAAAVAHQINNPLTTILVDSELLLRSLPAEGPHTASLEAILRAGKRAHEVVRRLLTMARQQSSDDGIEPIDVNETIHNTLMLVKGHIQQGGVQLRISLAEDLPPVGAPNGQLEDVWLNLLLNARDAVSDCPNPEIGIASWEVPGEECVEVVVWDNGIGIPPDKRDEIFEPFYTTKAPGEGTGLGLHICRQVIEKCGGSLRIESAEQAGTQFYIRLPMYNRRD